MGSLVVAFTIFGHAIKIRQREWVDLWAGDVITALKAYLFLLFLGGLGKLGDFLLGENSDIMQIQLLAFYPSYLLTLLVLPTLVK